jgi:hypothetical protein
VASEQGQAPHLAGHDTRPIHPTIRITLAVTAVFLLTLGVDLTLAPGRTDEFFSWPIKPSLTAGTIGAFYITGCLLIATALIGSAWARARTVIAAGVVFSVLAIVATFIDLDRFNFDSDETIAVVVSWVWILSYAIVPVLLLLFLIPQSRVPGVDPRTGPPPRWLRTSLWAAGGLMVAVAAGLSVVPEDMADIWPWTLTPLTARVLGSWIAGLGIVCLWAAWENDRFRMLSGVATLAFVGPIQLLTVLRFEDQMSWDEPGAWIYVGVLGSALVAGGLGLAQLRQANGAPAASAPTRQPSPET